MTKNKKGFTIIEVVLVLAIAGLIFLMVFIALPALQRSQRNTRRRQDMARILSAFTEYQSNVGHMPETADDMDDFVDKYVNGGGSQGARMKRGMSEGDRQCYGDQFCDPDGTPYSMGTPAPVAVGGTATFGESFNHNIGYYNNAKCSQTEGQAEYASGKASIALFYTLEGGAIYCGDNQ